MKIFLQSAQRKLSQPWPMLPRDLYLILVGSIYLLNVDQIEATWIYQKPLSQEV
jgi:hypothetical protein